MRHIGDIKDSAQAQRFGDILYSKGIAHSVDEADGNWEIWISDEDHMDEARILLSRFQGHPNAEEFADAAAKANKLRTVEAEQKKKFKKNVRDRDRIFRDVHRLRNTPIVSTLIIISVLVTLITNFGQMPPTGYLMFSNFMGGDGGPGPYYQILHGQVWRLVTPAFLHLDWMHIFFNMWWMYDLGRAVERNKGTLFALAFFIVSAALSNNAQCIMQGPIFGGMSGVVYALLGYVWMRGKYDPTSRMALPQQTVIIVIGWMIFGFLGFMDMANYAHLGGLVVGCIWGYLEAMGHRR